MTAEADKLSELVCHNCGYDLRAHPQDGRCPECGASVAEARRLAAIPRRPAWRDSDPRWRRRVLAGTWILVFTPLLSFLRASGWASSVPVPAVFDYGQSFRTLEQTFLCRGWVYEPLVFCIGVVLLFTKERKTHASRLAWARRWGVFCNYVVLLLSVSLALCVPALVLLGISSLFMSIPLKYQPAITGMCVDISTTYVRYGPWPKQISVAVLAAFSSIAILLACVPLFDALRSSGRKWAAAILLAPLALFSLMHLGQAGWCCLGLSGVTWDEVSMLQVYFRPELLANYIARVPIYQNLSGSVFSLYGVEAVKWLAVLAIAVWLSIAQFATWRRVKTERR